MKAIKCRDVGVNCDYEARGNTNEEVLKNLAEHARSEHNMKEIPAELQMKARAAIKDIPERRGA
jgi:predicted small metal-binding protein